MSKINPLKCPFCGEPAVHIWNGGANRYRCGTEGPDKDGNYGTGRVCEQTTYLRLIADLQASLAAAETDRDRWMELAKKAAQGFTLEEADDEHA